MRFRVFGLSRIYVISVTIYTGAPMFRDTKSTVSLDDVSRHRRIQLVYMRCRGSHGPEKPAFCRCRQGKLVYNITNVIFGFIVS